MRFKKKFIQQLDKRTITYFAFFPVTILRETRWLEMVRVVQFWGDGESLGPSGWINLRFEDKQ